MQLKKLLICSLLHLYFVDGRVKNHILPGEPNFATFYDNNFQCAEANFGHFFESASYNIFGFHLNTRNKSISMTNKEITRN